jgi:hypothetical protein
VDFVRRWSDKTEIGAGRFIGWLDITASKFYDWRDRYGKVNEHNGWVPRDFWLEDWEKQAIIGFHLKNPLEGYRRLTFMMLDADIVAVSPTSVWRVLGQAGLLSKWNGKPSKKGTGFEQPLTAQTPSLPASMSPLIVIDPVEGFAPFAPVPAAKTRVSRGGLRCSWRPWEPAPIPGRKPRATCRWKPGYAATCTPLNIFTGFQRWRFPITPGLA